MGQRRVSQIKEKQKPKRDSGVQDDARFVLLVGVARSGTTWLAAIANTYNNVIYCHEPFWKLACVEVEAGLLVRQMRDGVLQREGRHRLYQELIQAHPEWSRPPFFPKTGRLGPCLFQEVFWLLGRATPLGGRLYRNLYTLGQESSHDLLIKEVSWARYLEKTIDSLSPELILVIRHPCAVISSLVKGRQLGLMPKEDRNAWLRVHKDGVRDVGFSASCVLAMDDYEFLALDWLLENLTYQRVLENRRRTFLVVYERLCEDPLRIAYCLFEFLGWPMGPETKRFIDTSTGNRGSISGSLRRVFHRYFGVYRDTSRVSESWKSELPNLVKERIISIARLHPCYRDYWPE